MRLDARGARSYTYVATYGMLAASASLYTLRRYLDGASATWLGASRAFLALTLLTMWARRIPRQRRTASAPSAEIRATAAG